jgi:hypothetical protein
MRTQDFEGDRVKVGTKKGGGLVTGSRAKDGEESFLREFFCLRGIGDAAAEESKEWLLVARE